MTMAKAAAATGGGGRRYALLLALHDSDYVRETRGGYYNIFVDALGDGGERWDCFRVIDGEFPAAEELGRYDGFVVSGSPHDAHSNDLWVLRLCRLIQTLHAMKKRLLGICFGHQVLCRALGGKVGRSRSGWDVGIRRVTFVQDLEGFKLHGDLEEELPRIASIIQVHQDEVWEIPPRAKVLAYSDKTSVEVFAVGDHVLGIQGHPEYSAAILRNLIDRLVSTAAITRRVGEDAQAAAAAADGGETDSRFWTGLCKGFLRGGGGGGGGARVPAPEQTTCSSSRVVVAAGFAAAAAAAAAAAPIGL